MLRTDDVLRVPYLAPEIQLLFKSTAVRPKDQLDAEEVVPRLAPDPRRWLAHHLGREHPWHHLCVVGEREAGPGEGV